MEENQHLNYRFEEAELCVFEGIAKKLCKVIFGDGWGREYKMIFTVVTEQVITFLTIFPASGQRIFAGRSASQTSLALVKNYKHTGQQLTLFHIKQARRVSKLAEFRDRPGKAGHSFPLRVKPNIDLMCR
jgi:hypothetical protein